MSVTAVAGLPGRETGAEVQQGHISVANFLLVVAQLGLLLLLLRQFQIESAAFRLLAMLAFAGFAVHAWLPLRLRLPFFTVLSLAGIVVVMGAANAAWLVAIGLVLIGICHLPLSFAARCWARWPRCSCCSAPAICPSRGRMRSGRSSGRCSCSA